ncbi:methyltransferase domain-containing protein [Pseudooceanicola sediminis]|uniref:Chemotaxis protein methyltransferase n=1 Tax=Pseudooceanicola sediminis TaxID=2211117 RepID=A0A399IYF3_9RHOB|nr:CheR family methyltransferase [Pseudooceanicola sediminis]KAA2311400.1 methyltransferase domain-containing protein [Puniceibacterium sp. HSS470]RII38020.1 methyltransferase domain-containing protein [Pseudooceanicola sediminis]|tara:strand:+ start:15522 stop:16376 length:855 start_codon:yes stop_codon:yes gene_type:complete
MAVSQADSRHVQQFRQMMLSETGINLSASKDVMIESRLKRRLIALELNNLAEYFSYLFDAGGLESELPDIVDLLTTNKTDFFRENAHFDMLAERLIPEALVRERPGRPVNFKVWSAASSTGAEAWTIAMILARATEADRRLNWKILGTDISSRVLAIARRAIYAPSDMAPVPADMRAAYVMTGKGKHGEDLCRIAPELRARVRFAHLNLTDFPYVLEQGLDVVFLRNVLIYFKPELQRKVVAACARQLRPGGYLIVGHSESMIVRQPDLMQVAPGVFCQEGRRI